MYPPPTFNKLPYSHVWFSKTESMLQKDNLNIPDTSGNPEPNNMPQTDRIESPKRYFEI
jgi:hypothetical protein